MKTLLEKIKLIKTAQGRARPRIKKMSKTRGKQKAQTKTAIIETALEEYFKKHGR